MEARDFCYWLMGSLELSPPEDGLNEEQTQILKNHLNMVFIHVVNEDGTLKEETEIYEQLKDQKIQFTKKFVDDTKTTGYHESLEIRENC